MALAVLATAERRIHGPGFVEASAPGPLLVPARRRVRGPLGRARRAPAAGRPPAVAGCALALGVMELLQPGTWEEALDAKAAHPEALPLWGGTDVMVDLNFGRERPEAILDLTRVQALTRVGRGRTARCGSAPASPTRGRSRELGDRLPGLAAASRTVGSPQIRNRGTIGGNLGSSSPAGDALPPLYASRRRGRAGVARRHPPRADRRLHHRPQAQLPRAATS